MPKFWRQYAVPTAVERRQLQRLSQAAAICASLGRPSRRNVAERLCMAIAEFLDDGSEKTENDTPKDPGPPYIEPDRKSAAVKG